MTIDMHEKIEAARQVLYHLIDAWESKEILTSDEHFSLQYSIICWYSEYTEEGL